MSDFELISQLEAEQVPPDVATKIIGYQDYYQGRLSSLIHMNVDHEDLWETWWQTVDKKSLVDRGIALLKNEDSICVVNKIPTQAVVDYYAWLYWAPLRNEQYVTVEQMHDLGESFAPDLHFHFITSRVAENISKTLRLDVNSWGYGAVEEANNKLNMFKVVPEYTEEWKIVSVNDPISDLVNLYHEYGGHVFVKLGRSASWVWVFNVQTEDKLHEVISKIKSAKITNELQGKDSSNYTDIVIQKAMPWIEWFYSQVWYVDVTWNVQMIWEPTRQIIRPDESHEWNTVFGIDDNVSAEMKRLTPELAGKYYEKFWSRGFFGIDYAVTWEWKVQLMEFNWRVTWAYNLHDVLDTFDLRSEMMWTESNSYVYMNCDRDEALSRLRKANLLFDGQNTWIFPVAFSDNVKMQWVIVARDENEKKSLFKKILEVLS